MADDRRLENRYIAKLSEI